MIRFILLAFICLVLFLPTAQAEEKYEATICSAGTITVFHDSKDLVPVMSISVNSIITSQSEHKFLDNVTGHCEIVWRGVGENAKALGYCRFIDPEGDILIMKWDVTGKEAVGTFLEGTGKYKGIKASHKSEPLARGKPPMKGYLAGCRKLTGTYELAK